MHKSKSFKVIQYIFAVLIFLYTMGPYLWLFISSISYKKALTAIPLKWIPNSITWQRYIDIFSNPNNDMAYTFRIAVFNSLIVGITVMVISIVVGGLAAYAFARLRFRFRKKLIYLFLFTYMIPPVVIVIPLYITLNKLGMLDSKTTLILLGLTFTIPFVIWIMQNYFESISFDFEEAAQIDGCNRLQSLWYIIVPLAYPGFVATGILSFLLAWEEFIYALLFTSTLNAKTMTVAIAEFTGRHGADYGMIATGGILASLPPVIIAVLFQRYLIKGMAAGGIKE